MSTKQRILITGAGGQLGANLIDFFNQKEEYQVIATDIRQTQYSSVLANESLNVLDKKQMLEMVTEYEVTQIYHLAALLSANGEKAPLKAWDVNMNGLLNVLECAKDENLRVFWPSSIAIFGETTPKHMTPQKTITEPSTAYGISKLSGELWCLYYHKHFGVDVRSVRFPGLISWKGDPGGGTTDYAVEIFHEALKNGKYACFLSEDTYLPMLYMPDAIEGIFKLMKAPKEQIKYRDSYNISGVSFSPREVAEELQKHLPSFEISYEPDFRQNIANGWPASIEDTEARADWGWAPKFDLSAMAEDMLKNLRK